MWILLFLILVVTVNLRVSSAPYEFVASPNFTPTYTPEVEFRAKGASVDDLSSLGISRYGYSGSHFTGLEMDALELEMTHINMQIDNISNHVHRDGLLSKSYADKLWGSDSSWNSYLR